MPNTVAAVDNGEGQLVVPFYVICDVSGSMFSAMSDLNAALVELTDITRVNPVVDDLTMLSVITFQSHAQTVVPLSRPSQVILPTLHAGGGTNYGEAFREYHRSFEMDLARLKSEGRRVYRPCVFFLSDGVPGDPDYLATFRSLLAYDPETRQGNRAFPYVATFGFRKAPLRVMRELAYPTFGETRGRWFLARTGRIGDVLMSIASTIGNTIISSGMRASAGLPQAMPPAAIASRSVQFGDAADFV